MNPVRILIGIKNVSRCSDEEEAQWESMQVFLFTTVRQKFQCAVLTVCTIPMSRRTQSSQEEGTMKDSSDGTSTCEICQVAMLDE